MKFHSFFFHPVNFWYIFNFQFINLEITAGVLHMQSSETYNRSWICEVNQVV